MVGKRALRLGVVGLGFGADVHVPAFDLLPDVEVVALLGRNAEKAASAESRLRIPVFTDPKSFFASCLDAVSVAVPPGQVEAIVEHCHAHRLPVLCEKPLGSNTPAAERMAQQYGDLTTALDFEFAELETFLALHEAIHARKLGDLRHVQVTWLNESWVHRSGTWSWKTDADRDGGVLNLFGTHVLYLMEWLAGPVVALSARMDSRVTAQLKPNGDARAAEDLVHATFDHASGAVTSITIGNANPGLTAHRWTVVGSAGSAVIDNSTRDYMGGFRLVATSAGGEPLLDVSEPAANGDGRLPPFKRLAERFVTAVRAGTTCHPGFGEGARVQLLVDAIRQAALDNRTIEIQRPL
ncbi:Gfo/Idh/MocA family protein [Bradyrhizobium genomosp. III]|uniref:Gfo/Idh/MocA family protein n=1 Tax=Bradyrhizobium genomosp. III TaxID=2683271 RepID=UPI0005775F40|nr:Gfo/Idh/MocA family oxidoreductase [Bradyrhizobium sp. CCBAU 15615]